MNSIRLLQRKVIKSESGITLTELLIYLVITAFLSLGISRLITDSAAGLDRASQESIAARQVIRFYNTLNFDISGSTDVKIFPVNISPSTHLFCKEPDTKPLFTVKFKKLNKNGFDSNPVSYLSTYGLNEEISGTKSKWYLRRVQCVETLKDSNSPDFENLVYLGDKVNPNVTSGNTVLTCVDAKCSSYKIELPFKDSSPQTFSTIKKLAAEYTSKQTLTRKVDLDDEN